MSNGNQMPAPAATGGGRRRARPTAGYAALLALGLALALAHPKMRLPFWVDEAIAIRFAAAPSLVAAVQNDAHPPLYYALVRVLLRTVGTNEIGLRLLSVAFYLALALGAGLWYERLFPGRRGLWATALTILSPPIMEHAQLLRPYTALAFLSLLSCWGFHTLLSDTATRPTRPTRPTHRRWVTNAWYILTTTAALYTHYWAGFLVLAQLAVAGMRHRNVGAWLARFAAIAICFAPWLPTFLAQMAVNKAPHIEPARLRFLAETVRFFCVGTGRLPAPATWAALIVPAGIGALVLRAWRRRMPDAESSALLLAFTVLPLVIALLYSWVCQPVYFPGRYEIVAFPAFILLVAALADELLPRRWLRGAFLTAFALLCIAKQAAYAHVLRQGTWDNRRVAAYLDERLREGDALIWTGLSRPGVEFYLANGRHAALLGRQIMLGAFPVEMEDHPTWMRAQSPAAATTYEADAKALLRRLRTLAPGSRIYLLFHDGYGNRLLTARLAARWPATDLLRFRGRDADALMCERLTVYVVPPAPRAAAATTRIGPVAEALKTTRIPAPAGDAANGHTAAASADRTPAREPR